MSSVKVAVRCRPFNEREKNMNATCCIKMEGNSTTIFSEEDKTKKTFAFDYSYWSHDGFENDENGYSIPTSKKYADQKKVYSDLGTEVLDNAWEGYNACLFAYGQTGSGKSYSMVGYGANKGIVPMVCEEIFERVVKGQSADTQFEVTVSMLEIYNEAVQDLLVKAANRPKGGLKIRQSPQLGVYVQDLTKHPVDSYISISKKLDEGTSNRTVGATLMNATSSRAHTVLNIQFKQVKLDNGVAVSQKSSDINLVDLAGSERAGSTGAAGDRLKEGAAINQSLSALGNVISALADKASGKLKGMIPYRDSALTRILQTALGGNSKTTMIAAVSPASVNHEESLGTLRYADRVKQIKNVAQVNENPMEKLIRELKEENDRLKKMMGGEMPAAASAVGGGEANEEQVNKIKAQYEEELAANRNALEEMTKSWQTRLKEQKEKDRDTQEQKNENMPNLKNLNEDPLLCGKIIHVLKDGTNKLGKQNKDEPPDITLGGLGINKDHAVIIVEVETDEDDEEEVEYKASILPHSKTLVNGKVLTEGKKTKLNHRDRILFGNHNFFVYMDPSEMNKKLPTYEEALKEAKHDELGQLRTGEADEELQARLAEMQAKLEKERKEAEEKMKKQQQEMEQQKKIWEEEMKLKSLKGGDAKSLAKDQKELERKLQEGQRELEAKAKKLKALEAEQEDEKKAAEAEMRARMVLEEILARTIAIVDEANTIAEEMNKRVSFSIKLVTKADAFDSNKKKISTASAMQNTDILIKVENWETQRVTYWSLDALEERMYQMREMYANWAMLDPDQQKADEQTNTVDPFEADPNTQNTIGSAYLYLDPLVNMLDCERETIPIFDYKGLRVGELVVSLTMKILPEKFVEKGGVVNKARDVSNESIGKEESARKAALDDYDSISSLKGRCMDVCSTVVTSFLMLHRRMFKVSCQFYR
eukprot:GHVL01037854.1.p1 GENE.GHVL01037854.1~~GHVL01037854.1.p1  ORF type:complete len:935 (+),score=194.69 GHVL01037854.1:93-2897(+)